MTKEEAQKLVSDAANALAEHFDAVQILCSIHMSTEEGTRRVYNGRGNWYARTGMAHEFIQCDQADELSNAIAAKLNPEDCDCCGDIYPLFAVTYTVTYTGKQFLCGKCK